MAKISFPHSRHRRPRQHCHPHQLSRQCWPEKPTLICMSGGAVTFCSLEKMSSLFIGVGVPMKTELFQLPTSRSCVQENGAHFVFSQWNRPIDQLPRGDFRLLCTHPGSWRDTVQFPAGSLEKKDDEFDSGGDGGSGRPFVGGGGNAGGDDDDDYEEKNFGPLMKFDEVLAVTEARGAVLPADMLESAKSSGLRQIFLDRYLDLQDSVWPLRFLMRHWSVLRNRMLADPSFLFKVGTEVAIDSCCATFAEVQKRGKDFWTEFELYAADLLVGIVVDVALVGMLAPYVRFGKQSTSSGFIGRLQHNFAALPSSVFEAEKPGVRFSIQQRIATFFYKAILYGSVGFGCGIIGQGIANTIMNAKRNFKKTEEDVPVPPLVKSALLWGVFLGVSSNARYQIINGLEQLVEASPVVKRTPFVAKAFTVGIRTANNIYGGMQFVDWARWSGVQ